MIEGMIRSLDDPYTEFIPPAKLADFDKQIRGTYVGIGAEVNVVDGWLTIVSPMDGSPALEAGVLAGDIVLEIEGESTYNEPINESIARLMGEPNTPVSILVRHADGTEQELTIVRRQITTTTVRGLVRNGERWNYCLNDELGIGYIRLTQFTQSTREELHAVLDRLKRRDLNGLVFDLRDNPGGSLAAAAQVADMFISAGPIVSVRDRHGEGDTLYAQSNGTLPDFPMVILLNSGSASASEIVAGALQENGRAKVLGTRSFGKGSVQEVRELPFNQGTIKYTSAHYHLPSGRNLNRLPDSTVWGVDPDAGFVLPVDDESYVTMLRARREYEIIRENNGSVPACLSASWIREHLKDAQLVAAVESIEARVRGEAWPKPGADVQSTVVAFDQELKRAADERTRLLERLNGIEQRMLELQDVAGETGRTAFVPDDVDLVNGTVTVRDRHGNVIGTFRIDGGNVNMALQSMRLTPVEND